MKQHSKCILVIILLLISFNNYYSQYLDVGLIKGSIKLKELRDNYDVAHYSLDPYSLDEVEKNYGIAIKIAIRVIKKYRDFLNNKRVAHNQ